MGSRRVAACAYVAAAALVAASATPVDVVLDTDIGCVAAAAAGADAMRRAPL